MQPSTEAMEAVGEWYHAWFTGIILMTVSRRGAPEAAELVFRVFRQQQQARFLPGLEKLGLSGLPPAIAAARYHYLSNAIGGVGVEYHEESPKKAWIRYPPPRWIWQGTAICGIPPEVNIAMLRGWHAQNGVSLNCPRLGFVCTGQTVEGYPGLEGYYLEHDHELTEAERLRFTQAERMPRFDPAAAPALPPSWPAERLAKAKRGYAMEYVRSVMQAAAAQWGAEEAGALLGLAARLTAMQHAHQVARALGATDGLGLLLALAAAQGDAAQHEGDVTHQPAAALFRGLDLPAPLLRAWAELHRGALLAFDPLATLEFQASAEGFAWRITPSRG
ncbi:hypothetical protein KTR66_00270 [Roseococcus sp. SDR]|uniref:hypothetical protein n=1 Tax=Roseococcus sp. SDR TaxID=2835532 RepID=UPI001BCE9265|nr:hypothetical protein [Roseococcus sp. SDR]MBS7788403.1 hypothetical protein [Roseococcus sp. SDR]MBV1843717.1 hypothetical protein [Roseococcus sp. SDR]